MEKKPQIIFADPDDDVKYNLRGNLINVTDLTATQLEIGYWRTLEDLGKIAGQMKNLYIKHQEALKIVDAISRQAIERKVPVGSQVTVAIKEYV